MTWSVNVWFTLPRALLAGAPDAWIVIGFFLPIVAR
jgi:hypothetical protein